MDGQGPVFFPDHIQVVAQTGASRTGDGFLLQFYDSYT
jgi:hypothetical protein